MGAHRIENTMTVSRVLGRGAVATSAALALAGSSAGLALATPGQDHGDDGDSSASGRSASYTSSSSAGDGQRSATICDTADGSGLVGGLLGDLGLDESTRSQARCDVGGSEQSPSGSTDGSGSSSGSGQQQASSSSSSSSVQRTPQANPADEPPELGETKVLRIPMG